MILDQVVRGFPPSGPSCWRFEYPLFESAPHADPTAVAIPTRPKPAPSVPAKTAKRIWTVLLFVSEFLGEQTLVVDEIEARACTAGFSKREVGSLLRSAEAEGRCVKTPPASLVNRLHIGGRLDLGLVDSSDVPNFIAKRSQFAQTNSVHVRLTLAKSVRYMFGCKKEVPLCHSSPQKSSPS